VSPLFALDFVLMNRLLGGWSFVSFGFRLLFLAFYRIFFFERNDLILKTIKTEQQTLKSADLLII
jgi:hypothetical protein